MFDKYLRSKIDVEEVVYNFFVLYSNHHYESEKLLWHPERLKKFQIVSKSEGFSDLINHFFFVCKAVNKKETDDNSGSPLSENSFRKVISLRLQKLKNYY